MKTWQKIGIATLLMLAIFGIRVYFLWQERSAPGVQKTAVVPERPITEDQTVVPRKMLIDDVKSAKALIGKTVWMQAGFELDYFPYAGHSISFAHREGVLPSVAALAVKDIVVAKAPASLKSRVPLGDKQAYAIFQLSNDIPQGAKEYAVPIGSAEGSDWTFFSDDIFYYDDPHQMYKHWAADVWQAVDRHEAKAGMNELQVAMALGMIQQSDSSAYGDRTVYYDVPGKHWTVTFQNNKATNVQVDNKAA